MQARGSHERHRRWIERWALKVWEAMYRYILDVHYPQGGDWMFVHYDQLLDHCADAELERRLGSGSTANSPLPNSIARGRAPRCRAGRLRLYERLCALARYGTARRDAIPHRSGGGPCSVSLLQHYQHPHAAEPSRKRPRDPVLGLHQRGQSVARQKAVRTESAA